ncbi:MAG TPA: T9SS type A sorting domain-containing protein [Candidatus Sulfotelmatobacter sp.]|nr:T9SS type A sorting domain-containing protein [Candidatus Sulfotelmatobacter sp.]
MKKFATQVLAVAALLVLGATMASAANKYPPGPSYRSCTDSLTIYSIEQTDTTLAPCHPALLDTVLGVRGVIVGFDPRGSAYGFYIQNGTGPWTGIDIFTGASNYLSSVPSSPSGGNLVLGDSVAVYGTTQEFPDNVNGTTEIEGPDVNQSTNDIIIRKVGHTSLPPVASVSVHNLSWIAATSPQGEAWEGCLVKIIGPLKVARISGTGILSSNYLVTTVPPSADSVLVDGFTLTSVAASAPSVGTVIDSIYGIVNENTQAGATSYRIQIRGGNDVYVAVPPTLGDAYPIEDNKLRLIFDRDVDPTTAQDAANYTLASGIDGSTVDSAVMETIPGSVVDLNITSVRTDGDFESVTATGIGAASCPACVISPGQTRSFVNGVLTIAEVQQPDPANLPLFDDRSRFAGAGALTGTRLTFRGIGIAPYGGSLYYMMDENGQQRGGMSVFGPTAPILPGHRYEIAGVVQEFGGETEALNTVLVTDEGIGTIPAPNVQPVAVLKDTTTDMTQTHLTGEDFEGMLVKISYVRVTEQRAVGLSWFAAGPNGTFSDTILVSNFNGVLNGVTPPDSAHTVDVTGVLHFAAGTFRVCPRNASDIVDHGLNVGVTPGSIGAISFAISPNPARTSKIAFAIPKHSQVSLGVFDLQGRQVAQLANGSFAAGTYSREWSGLDASGNRVHSGVYFYRLKVGSETRVLRGVLLQ